MAFKKLTNANKVALFTDWITSATNRGDTFIFITSDINAVEIQQLTFNAGIQVGITQVDSVLSKVTFVNVLS